MTNKKFVKVLRDIADFFETNPSFPLPYIYSFDAYVNSKEELRNIANMMGACEKKYSDSMFSLIKQFNEEVSLRVHANREKVCERVVIGKKMVEREVVLATGKKYVEEEIVEWKCTDVSLLNEDSTKNLNEPVKVLGE